MPTSASSNNRLTDPYASRERHRNEGQGRRLTAAFAAVENFPMLAATRNQVLRLFDKSEPATGQLIRAVEGDLALTIAVMRIANSTKGSRRRTVDTVVQAVELLTPMTVLSIAERGPTYDFFERSADWQDIPERVRLHGAATQRAVELIAGEVTHQALNRLMVTAMMHDLGKLVLGHAYPGYPEQVHGDARTPEQRVQHERRELGIDHALVGGVIARRWGLPDTIAKAIETHHSPNAHGEAAVIRLADMLAHNLLGDPITPSEMLTAGGALSLSDIQLRQIIYELPLSNGSDRPRQVDPCPMSARELDVLTHLAKGMVYKQIAAELSLSTSTVRTHLHNIYRKLGANDRAQAVLSARDRGWI